MDETYWHQKWAQNDIGFHKQDAHPLLTRHFGKLPLAAGARIFVPLCGKTRDIAWLLGKGFGVAGAELSQIAVEQLFADLDVIPTITQQGNLSRYQAKNIDIFVGNLFDLTEPILGSVDGIYDRAAMVALPPDVRPKYARHLGEITAQAPQLLLTLAYDQTLASGPPFSVEDQEVEDHYQVTYALTQLAKIDLAKGIKGRVDGQETVWLLEAKP